MGIWPIALVAAATVFGPIKDLKSREKWDASYGCSYFVSQEKNDPPPYFVSGTDDPKIDERFALINVNGKDVTFKLTKREDSKSKKAKAGDKSRREYVADKMKLDVEFIVANACKASTGCESDERKMHLTLTLEERKYSVDLVGYCAI